MEAHLTLRPLLIATCFATLASAQRFLRCGSKEERCAGSYCEDLACDGRFIESASRGLCKCVAGYYRSRQTRNCEPTPANCLVPRPSTPRPTRPFPVFPAPLPPTLPPTRPPPTPAPAPFCPPQRPCPVCDAPRPVYQLPRDSERIVYRFYHVSRQNHFLTATPKEASDAMQTLDYEFEGVVGRMAKGREFLPQECQRDAAALRRFYKGGLLAGDSDHVYSVRPADQQAALRNLGYRAEGILGWCMVNRGECGATLPLFRFYNAALVDHFYTTRPSIAQRLRNTQGWRYEGEECHIWP